MRRIVCALVIGLLAAAGGVCLAAGGWQWPAQMSIAGFSVVDVRGSVNPDGSGSAVGTLRLPPAATQRISLARSPKGEITGNAPINIRIGAVELSGAFVLDTGGLRGKGVVKTSPKAVLDAAIVLDPKGQASGTGRVELGSIAVPVKFTISAGPSSIAGSVPVRSRTDTPLALYEFTGDLKLDAGPGKLAVSTANGKVRRTGKLANQVSTQSVADTPVGLTDGAAKINVGGVVVVFEFFKP